MSLSCQKLEASRSSEHWRAYVEYVNSIVSHGVHAAINAALEYLIRNMSAVKKSDAELARRKQNPLTSLTLQVMGNEMRFVPSIRCGAGSLQARVTSWVDTAYRLAAFVNRLDNPHEDFVQQIASDEALSRQKQDVMDLLTETVNRAEDFRRRFSGFETLFKGFVFVFAFHHVLSSPLNASTHSTW